ncbi:hypothetical protein HanRHA438_Chr00c05g0845211 [Helianthus annuus]|nr:hypothetical protein HanRHA438_Chr00c05g0845211 [Helianthus annuus]
MSSFNVRHDEPPSATAALAAAPTSLTLFLTSFPFSPSINSLTIFFNPPAFTNPLTEPSHVSTRNPIFISSTTILAFSGCSAIMGHAKIGTPAHILSNTEFHPQWLTNPFTLSCFSISIWFTHSVTIIPRSPTLSPSSLRTFDSQFLTTHKKLTSDCSKPFDMASICCVDISACDPNATYNTELPWRSFWSSHVIHFELFEPFGCLSEQPNGSAKHSGPTHQGVGFISRFM